MARPAPVPLDQNRREIYFVSATDGKTPVAVKVDPTSGGIITKGATAPTGSGLTPYTNTALTASVVAVNATKSNLYDLHVDNPNTSMTFIQFFDTTGAVTLGTTPPTFVMGVPTNGVLDRSALYGYAFANGIKLAATTTPTGAVAPSNTLNITAGAA